MGEPEKVERELTPKELIFVNEYVKEFNATKAAKKAGYSAKSARAIGYENLTKPHIKVIVDKLTKARLEELGCTPSRVLQEISRLAHSDPANYYKSSKDGTISLKNITKIQKDHSAAIKKVKTKTRTVKETYTDEETGEEKEREITFQEVEFELHDKKGPLELLAKHHGIINNDMNIKAEVTLNKLEEFMNS